MNYTRLSVFAGAALMSAAIGLPAAAATTYRGYQAYGTYHTGYQINRRLQTYRPVYTRAYRPYRPIYTRAYQPYRPLFTRAYRPGRLHGYGVAARPKAGRGGAGGLATFYDPAPAARGFTAAHLSLPMGTRILVTNLSNRRSVMVRIADRGPEAWTGRVLDLSRTAAYSLGMIRAGVAPVTYRVVN